MDLLASGPDFRPPLHPQPELELPHMVTHALILNISMDWFKINLQENPTIDGNFFGVRLRFSLKPIHRSMGMGLTENG